MPKLNLELSTDTLNEVVQAKIKQLELENAKLRRKVTRLTQEKSWAEAKAINAINQENLQALAKTAEELVLQLDRLGIVTTQQGL